MSRSVKLWTLAAVLTAVASPALSDTRFIAFDADDRLTRSLTRDITLEIERGLFGATRVRGLFSSTARGTASFREASPQGVREALPADGRQGQIYAINPEGDGPVLGRVLCPGSQEAWLVVGRVRLGRPITVHAVGVWPDGKARHCAALNYRYRGEWASGPVPQGELPKDR